MKILNNWKKGVATLPVIVLMGGVTMEIVVAAAFVSSTLSASGYGHRMSTEALMAARAGAMDAVLKVVRDKDFSDAVGYNVTVGTRSAAVTVVQDSPVTGQVRVTSIGTALLRQKKIQMDLIVNSTTGRVDILTFEEQTL